MLSALRINWAYMPKRRMVILKKLRRNIDYRIEPHLIEVADFDNIETPFVQEVIDTGIKVA